LDPTRRQELLLVESSSISGTDEGYSAEQSATRWAGVRIVAPGA